MEPTGVDVTIIDGTGAQISTPAPTTGVPGRSTDLFPDAPRRPELTA